MNNEWMAKKKEEEKKDKRSCLGRQEFRPAGLSAPSSVSSPVLSLLGATAGLRHKTHQQQVSGDLFMLFWHQIISSDG